MSVHANAQYHRCPMGLIIAKLNNRKNYNEIMDIYDKRMSTVNEIDSKRYLSVKNLLK